jgi:ABC-type lipoprotein release transport system permease subunit
LNYLFNNRPQLAAAATNSRIAQLDVLMPRLVLAATPAPGVDVATLKRAVMPALRVEPLQVRDLPEEVGRLGSDMYIFLARRNVQIYLIGGILLAAVGILAVALANYSEDRRTLGLLRIRGCGPRQILQFLSAGLSAPAVIGLAFGALISLLVGYGITNLVWQLRELKTVVVYLTTHLAVSMQTAAVGAALVLMLLAILIIFTRWIFGRTARESLADH